MSRFLRRCLPALLVAPLAWSCSPSAPTPPPNIVLIYVDDLGWRDVGFMGSDYYETPHIDGLAAQGARFTSAYANAPNCAPSRAALLSGMYAPRTGIYTVGSAARGASEDRALVPVENERTLSLDVVTLAEALKGAGYTTGHAGKWHLGGDGHLPAAQGFDWSVAGDATGTPASYFYPYENRNRSIPGLEEGSEGEYLPDRLTDEAIGFVRTNSEAPFFLYLSHYSVHTPIRAKPEMVAQYEEKPGSGGQDNPTYAAMVQSVDEGVGRLLATLDELGISEHTVVIFYADNGGYGPATSMAPLRGSKGMLYEGGIREPLIVRWPGRTEAGGSIDVPVIGTDFYPTLLEIAGAQAQQGQLLDGTSFVPLMGRSSTGSEGSPGGGAQALADRPIFWHFPAYLEADASVEGTWRTTPASAVRQGRYKLIHFFEDGRSELYDLQEDIGETTDISSAEPGLAAELEAELRRWWADTGAFIPSERNPEYDPQPDSATKSPPVASYP